MYMYTVYQDILYLLHVTERPPDIVTISRHYTYVSVALGEVPGQPSPIKTSREDSRHTAPSLFCSTHIRYPYPWMSRANQRMRSTKGPRTIRKSSKASLAMARTTRMATAMRRSTLASKENFLPAGEGVRSRFSFSSRRELAATRGKVAAIREQWEQPLPVNAAANRTRGKSKHCIDQPQGSISREEHNVTMEEAATQCPAEPGPENGVPPSVACSPRGSGSVVHTAQRVLVRKHYEAKSKVEGLSGLGGGVSIWPSMDDMRLSKEDAFRLVKVCLSLVIVTIATFYWFHGKHTGHQYNYTVFLNAWTSFLPAGVHIARLRRYTTELERFSFLHLLTSPPATGYTITSLQMDQEVFEKRLMQWHRDFLKLLASVQGDLNVELSSASLFDVAFLLVYIVSLALSLHLLLYCQLRAGLSYSLWSQTSVFSVYLASLYSPKHLHG